MKGFLPSPALRGFIENIGIVHLVFSAHEPIPVKTYTPKTGDSIEFFLRDPEYVQYPGTELLPIFKTSDWQLLI